MATTTTVVKLHQTPIKTLEGSISVLDITVYASAGDYFDPSLSLPLLIPRKAQSEVGSDSVHNASGFSDIANK
jgi:hypothetical protein